MRHGSAHGAVKNVRETGWWLEPLTKGLRKFLRACDEGIDARRPHELIHTACVHGETEGENGADVAVANIVDDALIQATCRFDDHPVYHPVADIVMRHLGLASEQAGQP